MEKIDEYFYITVSSNKMIAEIHCKESYNHIDMELNVPLIITFLKRKNIIHGVKKESIEQLLTNRPSTEFPIIIAEGEKPVDGIDGKVVFEQDYNETDIVRAENWDFREVMRIPTVTKGEKLATIIPPTKSKKGKNVHAKRMNGRAGKPALMRAGKGVIFREENHSFYADTDGQVSATNQIIQVHSVYEVKETLSLEVGNIDFVGSVIINGDVPTGYTIKAAGDITIHGIVEAATIIAGGSIYVSGGLSGLKKGSLKAGENVQIGYINQGKVVAGHSILVENSIIHSNCSATAQIFCQRGNVIGGSISAGKSIEAKDIGNRLSTETMVNLGIDKKTDDKEQSLRVERQELTKTLKKVKTIGDMLTGGNKQQDAKMRVTMLKQRHSHQQISEKINQIDAKLHKTNAHLGSEEEAGLIVHDTLHVNVIVAFGKYERKINKTRQNVQLKLDRNDIVIQEAKE